jgi:uncharacterized membrane protein
MQLPVSKSLLNARLIEHPHYPSFLSISETLDEFGIENAALYVEKQNLQHVPLPFLAHIYNNGSDYELVTEKKRIDRPESSFYEVWSGEIIAASNTFYYKNKENENAVLKEKRETLLVIWSILSILLLSALASISFSGWLLRVEAIISLLGITISGSIVMSELGLEIVLAKAFCKERKGMDCDAVTKSSGSNVVKGLKWSDVGLIFFCGQWVATTMVAFSHFTNTILVLFKLLYVASMPFIAFSLYYQWRIARKWCLYCLSILGLLLVQIVLLTVFEKGWVIRIDSKMVIVATAVICFIGTNWLLIKGVLKQNVEAKQELSAARQFKNDIFSGLLQIQRKVTIIPLKCELEMANPNAPLKIVVVCSPYCRPCAQAHEILHELAEKYHTKISLAIRFAVDVHAGDTRNSEAVGYILQTFAEANKISPAYTRKALSEWFSMMDLEKFRQKYQLEQLTEVKDQLSELSEWRMTSGIEFTPAIFMNGFEFPKDYAVKDLRGLIRPLLNNFDFLAKTKF